MMVALPRVETGLVALVVVYLIAVPLPAALVVVTADVEVVATIGVYRIPLASLPFTLLMMKLVAVAFPVGPVRVNTGVVPVVIN